MTPPINTGIGVAIDVGPSPNWRSDQSSPHLRATVEGALKNIEQEWHAHSEGEETDDEAPMPPNKRAKR